MTATMRRLPQPMSIKLLFAGLCLVSLIPVLAFTYVPGVDLPNHVFAACLHAGTLDHLEGDFYTAELQPAPYVLFHLFMYPFVRLFGGLIAIKIILSLYVILLPLSVLLFVRQFNPGQERLAFFSFPLIYTFHFDYGFIPYCIGVPFVFLGLYLVAKAFEHGLPWRHLIAVSLVTLLIYLGHFVNFIAYVIGFFLVLRSQWAAGAFRAGATQFRSLREVGKSLLVFVPVLLCVFFYSWNLFSSPEASLSSLKFTAYASWLRQLAGAVVVFFSLDGWVDWLEMTVIGGLVIGMVMTGAVRKNKSVLGMLAVFMLLFAILVPRRSLLGGGELSSRFAVFWILPLLTSLRVSSRKAERLLVVAVTLLMAITIAVRTHRGYTLNNLIERFVVTVSATIPPGSKIYTIYNAFPESHLPVMRHVIAYYHLRHGGYSPYMFAEGVHPAGLKSNISLPRLHDRWQAHYARKLPDVLRNYDYLVMLTYGSELPEPLLPLSAGFVSQDSLCTVVDLSRVNLDALLRNTGS